jgi:hypothetical protein
MGFNHCDRFDTMVGLKDRRYGFAPIEPEQSPRGWRFFAGHPLAPGFHSATSSSGNFWGLAVRASDGRF